MGGKQRMAIFSVAFAIAVGAVNARAQTPAVTATPDAPTTTAPATPATGTLTGSAAWQTLVGNTVVAETRTGSYSEFYTADGVVKHLDQDGKTTGKWLLQGDKICFDFPDDDDRVCTKIEVNGTKGAFVDDDGSRDTFSVLTGNAKNL